MLLLSEMREQVALIQVWDDGEKKVTKDIAFTILIAVISNPKRNYLQNSIDDLKSWFIY